MPHRLPAPDKRLIALVVVALIALLTFAAVVQSPAALMAVAQGTEAAR